MLEEAAFAALQIWRGWPGPEPEGNQVKQAISRIH